MSLDKKIDEVLINVCNFEEGVEISDDMSPYNTEDWDSMNNIQLITELEEIFGIEFDFDELLNVDTWGDYKELVKQKVNQ